MDRFRFVDRLRIKVAVFLRVVVSASGESAATVETRTAISLVLPTREPSRSVALLALGILAGSCSSQPVSPSVPQIAGHWVGTATIVSVTGGECLHSSYASLVGLTFPYTLDLEQNGGVLSTGDPTCGSSGTIDGNQFGLMSAGEACNELQRSIICPNGALRDTRHTSAVIEGTITGSSISGTLSDTRAVYPASNSSPVDYLTITSSFSVSR